MENDFDGRNAAARAYMEAKRGEDQPGRTPLEPIRRAMTPMETRVTKGEMPYRALVRNMTP